MIFKRSRSRINPVNFSRIALALLAVGLFAVGTLLPAKQPAVATAGINSTLNFQGRLLTAGGAVVADGTYNLEFKIYQDGDGCVTGGTSPCSGTLKWTEDRVYGTGSPDNRVTVRNGYFSVALGSVTAFGSSVDWNQDTLWLTVNVGNTTTAANFAAASGDGEMLPMKRLSAAVYALNAGQLGGLTAGQYVQLAQGIQTDSSTSQPSIGINKTAGSQNLITLQASGADVFDVTSTGNLLFGNNANKTISVTTSAASTAGRSVTVSAGTGGSGTGSAGGNLVLQGGNGGGTSGAGGNVTISPGVKTGGTSGVVIITPGAAGNDSTTFFQVKSAGGSQVLTVDSGNGRVGINGAPTAASFEVNGTTVVGQTNSPSAFAVKNGGGAAVFGVDTTLGAHNVYLAPEANATGGTLTYNSPSLLLQSNYWNGSSVISSNYTIQNIASTTAPNYRLALKNNGGTEVATFNDDGSAIFRNSGNSQTAFRIQTAAGPTTIFNADTTNQRISVGTNGTATGQLYVAGLVPSTHLSSRATTSSPSYSIVVQNRYAYVRAFSAIEVYDISNPASIPAKVGNLAISSGPGELAISGRYLYSTNSNSNTMQIFDITNPKLPALMSTTSVPSSPQGVSVEGRYAVVVNNNSSNNVQVYDVTNPAVPVLVGQMTTSGVQPQAVFVQGRYAYVPTYTDFRTIDLSNPTAPAAGSTFSTGILGASDVYTQGKYAYLIENNGSTYRLRIMDVSDPSTMTSVGTLTLSNDPQAISVQGRYAYIAAGTGNVIQVVDVSAPASPVSVGTVPTSATMDDIAVQGRYAYAIDYTNSAIKSYDMGGTYTQQLEAGGIETGTLSVDSNASVAGDTSIGGSLNVGQHALINGNLGVGGSAFFQNGSDSTAALQVQNAAGNNVFTVDTTNQRVGIGIIPTIGAKLHVTTGSAPALRVSQTSSSYDIADFISNDTGPGTVAVTSGVNTVTGTSTTFLTSFRIGDVIQVGSQLRVIATIPSDTSMTTLTNFSATSSGSSYNFGYLGTGTVTTAGTTTLTGSGTNFATIFRPGDDIIVNGETVRTVSTVASNTSLTVTSAFSTSAGSLAYAQGGYSRLVIKPNGSIGVNTSAPNGAMHVASGYAAQVVSIVQAANGQTADLLQAQDSTGTVLAKITSAGALTAVGVNSGSGQIQGTGGLSVSGAIAFGGLSTNGVVYTSGGTGTLNSEANLSVVRGGTGVGTTTAYGLLTGGTTATGAFQNAGTGTSGQILKSNGNAALPTWVANTQANACSDCATTALSNLASVAINAALGFQSNQAANINFAAAAAAAGNTLTIQGQAAGGTTNAGGAITMQGGTATTTGAGGLLTLQGGNGVATGTNGGVTIDTGTGGTNAGTIAIGNSAIAHTIQVGSGAAVQGITIGSTNSTSTLVLQAGTGTAGGDINIGDQTTAGKIIDIGSVTNAGTGTVNIATGAAVQTVAVGSTNATSTLTLQGGTGTAGGDINIGDQTTAGKIIDIGSVTNAGTGTVNIATAAAVQGVTIGSTNSTSTLTLQAGTGTAGGDLNIGDQTTAGKRIDIGSVTNSGTTTVNIATSAAVQTVSVGSATAGSALTLQAGSTGNLNLTSGGSIIAKSAAASNSTTAFQIQDAGGTAFFTSDTTNRINNSLDLNVGGGASFLGSSGRLFSDAFESGNFKLWSVGTTTGASSTFTADTTTVRNGKYSAKAVNVNGSSVKTSIGSSVTAMARAYIYVTSHTNGNNADLITLSNATSQGFTAFRKDTTGELSFYNGATAVATTGSTAMTTGAWHLVEIDVTTGNPTGAATVYLDGTAVVTLTGQNMGASNLQNLILGDANARASTISYDDVAVDTVRPDGSASLNVGDSLHVSGTTSLGGNLLVQGVTNTTTALQVLDAANVSYLTVDTNTPSVTIGNSTGATAVAVNCGTGNCDFGTNAIAHATTIGSATGAASLTLQGGTGNANGDINIGDQGINGQIIDIGPVNTFSTGTIRIGTNGLATQTVTVGSSGSTSSLSLQAGTGNIDLGASASARTVNIATGAAVQTVHIADGAAANAITMGSATGAASTTIQAGTADLILKPITNDATAFTVQDSASVKLLVANTTTGAVKLYVGDPTPDANEVLFVLDNSSDAADPTGTNGAMYYNTTMGTMRCYVNGGWQHCNGATRLRNGYNVQEDFIGSGGSSIGYQCGSTANNNVSTLYAWECWDSGLTAPTVLGIAADTYTRPGQIRLSTGAGTVGTASGAASIYMHGGLTESFYIGGGETFETAVNVPTASSGTQEYVMRVGLCGKNTHSATNCTNGVYFEYNRAASSGIYFRGVTEKASTTTYKTDNSPTFVAGWTNLKFIAYTNASVEFFIKRPGDANYISLGISTTNIPDTTSNKTSLMLYIDKTVGTTARTFDADYVDYSNDFTAPR